jgi:hypothetical protein
MPLNGLQNDRKEDNFRIGRGEEVEDEEEDEENSNGWNEEALSNFDYNEVWLF